MFTNKLCHMCLTTNKPCHMKYGISLCHISCDMAYLLSDDNLSEGFLSKSFWFEF